MTSNKNEIGFISTISKNGKSSIRRIPMLDCIYIKFESFNSWDKQSEPKIHFRKSSNPQFI
jgi:hypothetical protein